MEDQSSSIFCGCWLPVYFVHRSWVNCTLVNHGPMGNPNCNNRGGPPCSTQTCMVDMEIVWFQVLIHSQPIIDEHSPLWQCPDVFLAKGPGASPECQREAARNFRLIRGHWSFPILMNFAGIKFNTTALVVLNDCPFFVRFFGLGFCHHDFFQIPLGFDQVLVKVHFFPMEFRPKPGLLGSLDKRRLMSRKIKRIRRRFWGADPGWLLIGAILQPKKSPRIVTWTHEISSGSWRDLYSWLIESLVTLYITKITMALVIAHLLVELVQVGGGSWHERFLCFFCWK